MQLSLRQARRLAEKTQEEMAKLLKVHPQTYRKIERNPNLATIEQAKRIAEALGKNYDDIFFEEQSSLTRVAPQQDSA